MRDPEATLRQHDLPVTAQRLAVLRAVSSHPHATADDLTASVCGALGTISRQSVYNVLNVLPDKGIIRRIQPPDSPARYEDPIGDTNHHPVSRPRPPPPPAPPAPGLGPPPALPSPPPRNAGRPPGGRAGPLGNNPPPVGLQRPERTDGKRHHPPHPARRFAGAL